MTGEDEVRIDPEIEAVLSGLSPEEVSRRLSLYAGRIASRERDLLLDCLGGLAVTDPDFDSLLKKANSFVDAMRAGDFAENDEWDDEWDDPWDDNWDLDDSFDDAAWEGDFTAIVDLADQLFYSGQRLKAAVVYGTLLYGIAEADEAYLLDEPGEDLRGRISETKARYLRVVYDELPSEDQIGRASGRERV